MEFSSVGLGSMEVNWIMVRQGNLGTSKQAAGQQNPSTKHPQHRNNLCYYLQLEGNDEKS